MQAFKRKSFRQYSRGAASALVFFAASCAPAPPKGSGATTANTAAAPAPRQEHAPSVPAHPNVVLIIVDTLRADKLHCYGCAQDTSPRLDALAAEGAQFDHVLAQCSWTRPSIGSMLTSKYPRTLGIYLEIGHALNEKFQTLAGALHDAGYATYGFTANPNINSMFNFDHGFDNYVNSDVMFEWMQSADAAKVHGAVPLARAPQLFRKALDTLPSAPPGKPVYLQFNLMEVHEWPAVRKEAVLVQPEYVGRFGAETTARYLELVRQVTDNIGAFVEQLTARPGWENTLFVFTSDHGESLGEHTMVANSMYHGRLLYESQIDVPLVFYQKGWNLAQHHFPQIVRLLDVMPTVLQLSGVPVPDGLDGLSLAPLLRGEKDLPPLPEYNVVETQFRGLEKIGVYTPEWKYFHNRKPQAGLPSYELDRIGVVENGIVTNEFTPHLRDSLPIRAFLKEWENTHPKSPPTPMKTNLNEDEKAQLKSLGYFE